MTTPIRRSIEVDFLRGVVLIVIAIDHIYGSSLTKFMLHNYAFCDAAEVFVFLGGYASAAAYVTIEANRGGRAATLRFLSRSVQIYRAYWLTAALMLASGAMIAALRLRTPMLAESEWPLFAAQPWSMIRDIALFRHQPYLAAVLPMYAFFALGASVAVPYARRAPVATLFASLVVWLSAPVLGPLLPSARAGGWGFNPFAWQFMFVCGMLARLHPVPPAFHASYTARGLTRLALGIALGFAFSKLVLQTQPMPGIMKQNLAPLRIVSFAALAWPVAVAVQRGWLRALASRMRDVVNVGQQGMPCFVAGAFISIVIDTALRVSGPHRMPFVAGLCGDALAISAVIATARLARALKRRAVATRGGPAVSRSGQTATMPPGIRPTQARQGSEAGAGGPWPRRQPDASR